MQWVHLVQLTWCPLANRVIGRVSRRAVVVFPEHSEFVFSVNEPDVFGHAVPRLTTHSAIATQIGPLLVEVPGVSTICPAVLLEGCRVTGEPNMDTHRRY